MPAFTSGREVSAYIEEAMDESWMTIERTSTLAHIVWLPGGRVWATNMFGKSYYFEAQRLEETLKAKRWLRGAPTANARSMDGRYAAIAQDVVVMLDAQEGVVRVLKGHYAPVTCLTFAPDGAWLVSGDQAGYVTVWEVGTGKLLAREALHAGPVRALVTLDTSAPGTADTLVSSASDGLRLSRLPALQGMRPDQYPQETRQGPAYEVLALAAGGDGRSFITADTWGMVRALDAESGEERWRLQHERAVSILLPYPWRDWMISANVGPHPRLKFWQVQDGQVVLELDGPGALTQLSTGWHGRLLVGRTQYDQIVVWGTTLLALPGLPLALTTAHDLDAVQATLDTVKAPQERAWWSFAAALLRWRRRFAIELEKAPATIQVGEFDIELEG